MAAPFDFDAIRAELAEEISQLEGEIAAGADALGSLALGCRLGEAGAKDLDKARAAQTARVVRVDELRAALRDVDNREAAHKAAEEAAARQRDTKDLAELGKARRDAVRQAIDLLDKLAPVVDEVCQFEQRERAVSKRLGVPVRSAVLIQDLNTLARSKLASLGWEPYERPKVTQEARDRLLAG